MNKIITTNINLEDNAKVIKSIDSKIAELKELRENYLRKIKWTSQDETKVNALNDVFRDYNEAAKEEILNSNSQFVDKNGRTLQEAQEELEIEKMNKILNENLDGTTERM